MTQQHTRGPWEFARCTIGDPENALNPMVEALEQTRYICRIGWQGATIEGMTNQTVATLEEAEANARLIAAAPDLLEALTKIAEHPEGVYSRDKEEYLKNVICWCQDTAAAAIAKATSPQTR